MAKPVSTPTKKASDPTINRYHDSKATLGSVASGAVKNGLSYTFLSPLKLGTSALLLIASAIVYAVGTAFKSEAIKDFGKKMFNGSKYLFNSAFSPIFNTAESINDLAGDSLKRSRGIPTAAKILDDAHGVSSAESEEIEGDIDAPDTHLLPPVTAVPVADPRLAARGHR